MSEDSESRPYKVGRGKPPIEHQFKDGTGNPRGRPKKPVRSLTERQPNFDIIRVAGQSVKLRRNGKVVTTTIIKTIWESIAAKAASGHAPSQRFFVKEYKGALEYMLKSFPELIKIVNSFEKIAGRLDGTVSQKDQEQLDHLRRRTYQLVDAYDERNDPYVSKMVREGEAYAARQAERAKQGVKAANVYLVKNDLWIEDPDSNKRPIVEFAHQLPLAVALQHPGKMDPSLLREGISIKSHSFDEASEFLEKNGVPFCKS